MNLNFDPLSLNVSANEKFIWITINHLLTTIGIIKKYSNNNLTENDTIAKEIAFQCFQMNFETLKRHVKEYKKELDKYICDLDLYSLTNDLEKFETTLNEMIR